MKELSLYIRPDKLETVKKILIDQFACGGMTVLSALGCGNQRGFLSEYKGTRTSVNLLPKMKVEVIVRDEDLDRIVEQITEQIATGVAGDGKIVVKNVEDVIRIRTKQRGSEAI